MQWIGYCLFLVLLYDEVYGAGKKDVLWNRKNCNLSGGRNVVRGVVTDAVCCNATSSYGGVAHPKCLGLDRYSCADEDTCYWRHGRCLLNRDKKNNVCCEESNIMGNCVDVMAAKCPKEWQVPSDCCPAPYDKYATVLSAAPGKVCCNAPCAAIELAWRGKQGNATEGIPPVAPKTHCRADVIFAESSGKKCSPAAKSYFNSMAGMGGMDINSLSLMLGMPVQQPMDIGQLLSGMGGLGGVGFVSNDDKNLAALKNLGYGSSKDSHVDEITVDDFFDALIEALDNDEDVYEYNKEINSDSWFGKQAFGGLVDGFKFINPWKFINQIYGSPFGLQNAQTMYGMQYGIRPDQFQKVSHQTMTGFPDMGGYGSAPSPYGQPPSPYGAAPTQYGPPTPPPYAPPRYPQPPAPQPPAPKQQPSQPEAEFDPSAETPNPDPQAQPAPPQDPYHPSPYPQPHSPHPPHYPQMHPDPLSMYPQQNPISGFDYYGNAHPPPASYGQLTGHMPMPMGFTGYPQQPPQYSYPQTAVYGAK